MAEPLLPLHQAFTDAANELIAFDARVAVERTALVAKIDAARAALAAEMPEGVPFASTPDHPPVVMKRGGEVVTVVPHFLGNPYPPAA